MEPLINGGHGTSADYPIFTSSPSSPDFGTYGYNAGVSGTVAIASGKRVTHIHAKADGATAATIVINGGDTITIPINGSVTLYPKGNLVAPSIVFGSTASYFVEHVE